MIDTSFNNNLQMMMIELIMKMLTKQTSQDESGMSSDNGSSGSSIKSAFSSVIEKASTKYDVDPDLINSVIKAESNFNPDAVSSCGAQGLMQLMPGTAKSLGVTDSFDPVQNINGGVKFLKSLLNRYGGNTELALAAYNAGPGAVDKYNGIPPYQETQAYVKRVIGYYNDQN
jgi:soluble lytic murein transglycosylase-like protein